MKKLLFFLPMLALGIFLFTGQDFKNNDPRWNNPVMTRINLEVQGQYRGLPVDNYVHPNSTYRTVQTPQGDFTVAPNFRVHPSAGTQSEVPIVTNPVNQSIMLASANTWRGGSFFSTGVYVTTNSGATWFGSDTLNPSSGDPGPTIDKDGRMHMSYITTSFSMGAAYSTNNGLNWSPTFTFPGATTSADKNLSGTDNWPASPFYGRSYTVYTEFGGTFVNRIVGTHTTNGGVSWVNVYAISPPTSAGHHHQGCDVVGGINGATYVAWANCTTNGQNSTEDSLGFATTTNGGVSWTARNNAANMNGIRSSNLFNGIRANGFPRIDVDRTGGSRHGWIYVVAGEKNFAPATDASDVVLMRSTDAGNTWSRHRVNQDAPGTGKLQYMPAVNVDAFGGINVVYYDTRNIATNDSAEVYVSRSIDGGNTWTDILVSDHRFKPKPISGLAGGYQGDYIGITSGNNKVWPYWADDITGIYQAWTTSIDLGPSVNHNPLPNTENLAGPYTVNATIIPAGSNIDPARTKVFWTRTAVFNDSVSMTNTGGNNWTANIPGNGTTATYRYFIRTADLLGRVGTSPAGAPAVYHQFLASPDNIKPVITHTPLPNQPRNTWPATVTATITDNLGLDSGWVRWYRNNTGTGIKQFKLTNTGGSTFTAAFNSVMADVNVNDSIFYRIFAQDNSTAHNRDSSALHKFKIINQATSCIGTGSNSIPYPFNTFWHNNVTDMVYLSSEILGNGGQAGNITKLRYDVLTASGQAMNNFEIKMQHTTNTTVTGFTSTGWTTVYSGTYTVPGTGVQEITLQNPFNWNGTQHLLIQICFDNTSFTVANDIKGTTASQQQFTSYADGVTGCIIAGSDPSTSKPNFCFVIDGASNIQQVGSTIPDKYGLAQNYPNPFNPATTISFSLPKQSLVSLKVFDIAGREVATLVNNTVKTAGIYNVDFDASRLASGVYFYRIQADNFVETKRMMLIK